MEPILTAPAESEILTRVSKRPTKPSWQDKKIRQSSNGGPPTKATIVPSIQTHGQSHPIEPEGWRYVEKARENGRVKYERVPLTRYELLHPQEGYTIVHRTPHDFNTAYAGNSTKINLIDKPDARVFGDLRTDLNLTGVTPISPDVSVMFGVSQEKEWSTFNCQEEGVYPSVVFEITSPGTRENDFDEKYEYYCRAGIPYYVILDIEYDRDDQVSGYRLYVFELSGGHYVDIQSNDQGRYWLPPLEMWVGVGEKGLLCYDAAGKLLMTPEELVRTLDEAERERDAAKDRAAEQERLAQQEAARAAAQEQIAQQQSVFAQQETARAAEQERIAQQETARAVEQERIARQETARAAEQERIAQQEAARAAEQERIAQQQSVFAQQETARAAEQERIAQEEAARAAEQERIAQQALQAQLEAEAKVAELLAQMAEFQDKANPEK